jgi:hypothetical protein
MSTRCKFVCNSVEHSIGRGGKVTEVQVVLNPVYGPTHENKAFWDATPNGRLELSLAKPEHVGLFEQGEEYYVDITSVKERRVAA